MQVIDNISQLLCDDLKQTVESGDKIKIAAATFSIYAFEVFKKELKRVEALMPRDITASDDEALQKRVKRLAKIEAKEREYTRLKAKRDKEKQFNKKVELNERLHLLLKEIETLKLNSRIEIQQIFPIFLQK